MVPSSEDPARGQAQRRGAGDSAPLAQVLCDTRAFTPHHPRRPACSGSWVRPAANSTPTSSAWRPASTSPPMPSPTSTCCSSWCPAPACSAPRTSPAARRRRPGLAAARLDPRHHRGRGRPRLPDRPHPPPACRSAPAPGPDNRARAGPAAVRGGEATGAGGAAGVRPYAIRMRPGARDCCLSRSVTASPARWAMSASGSRRLGTVVRAHSAPTAVPLPSSTATAVQLTPATTVPRSKAAPRLRIAAASLAQKPGSGSGTRPARSPPGPCPAR